ncbi:MAG: glutaminase domain-containing protein, partial [Bacillota bacterium]
QAMCGMARIDGTAYRFMGTAPKEVPAMEQVGVEVLPTRTIYQFQGGGVEMKVTFLSPVLPHDLEIMSRPVSYITWDVKAADGKAHEVAVYFDLTGEWAVDKANQQVEWSRQKQADLSVLRLGSKDQPILAKTGDNLRIDWGYVHLAVPTQFNGKDVIASDEAARGGFAKNGTLPATDDARMPRAVNDQWPVLACAMDLGKVADKTVQRHVLVGYDDLYGIQYFQKNLRPWWRRNGMEMPELLSTAAKDYAALSKQCEAYDARLMADLTKAGGERYARVSALAFRQCIAAHKLVASEDGKTPLYFSKENFSNGCIDTVDVTYPSAPFFLLFNPTLLKGQLTPILDYAKSDRWKFPFAPHDLGQYPKANGQVYGGGEKDETNQMPVEESGNMLLLVAAVVQAEGKIDYAMQYWPVLAKWAEFLKDKGLDPENQLCTDDFAGHLAHNVNLSAKAIVALGAFAQMAEKAGKRPEAMEYRRVAEQMAAQWTRMADAGDHYRLTFDRPSPWSQKYNLVWDKLLGMKLFPSEVVAKEIAYYKTKQNQYGLPLDSRKDYTKLDWIVWTATLTNNQADFETFIRPVYDFVDRSPSRVPLTDWYDTVTGKQCGFQARSVIGGVYIKMLSEPAMAKKWQAMSERK